MPLKRQEAGQNFDPSASTWNAFCDAAEAVEKSIDLSGDGGAVGLKNACIVRVKNASGAARDRFEVLQLSAPTITPEQNLAEFKNRITFDAIDLDDTPAANVVILQQPLDDGQMGRGVIFGATIARVEIADGDHKYAKFNADSPEILLSTDEATEIKILYNPGVGGALSVVRIGGGGTSDRRCNCYLVDAITDTVGPWDVYDVQPIIGASPVESPSETVSVYNPVGFYGDADGFAKIEWCAANDIENTPHWEFYMVACPTG